MKRFLVGLADLIIIFGSILLTFSTLGDSSLLEYEKNLDAFWIMAPIIGIMYLFFAYVFGLHNTSRQSLGDVIYTIFLVILSLMIGTMAACFFIRDIAFAYPRSVILISSGIMFMLLCPWKAFVWRFSKYKHGKRPAIIIGKDGETLKKTLMLKHKDIYSVKFACLEDDPFLYEKLEDNSDIFITSDVSYQKREDLFIYAAGRKINIFYIPKYADIGIINSRFYKTDDIPTFQMPNMILTSEEQFIKRCLDLTLALIALIISSPIFLIISLLVKLDHGEIFYRQQRLTINRKLFNVIKFRTMVPNAESITGPVFAGEDDPRITKIGRFLRATRLDELPQILNIIAGDMSIVGPRPERPFFTEIFEEQIPEFRYRLNVKAGLTGLAQVMGKYNTDAGEKLRYDLIYIINYSLAHDLIIIIQTIKILFIKSSTEGIKDKTNSTPENL